MGEPASESTASDGASVSGATAPKASKYILVATQGVSAVFALSAVFAAQAKNAGGLGPYIIIVCVVFGFLVVAWAFAKIARSSTPFWASVGMVLGTITLAAVTAVFVSVLTYLLFGQPQALDLIFRPGFSAPAVDSAKVSSVSPDALTISWTPDPRVSEVEVRATALGRSAPFAPAVNPFPPDMHVVLSPPDLTLRAFEDNPKEVAARSPGKTGQVSITGLQPAMVYQLLVTSVTAGRPSQSEKILAATSVTHGFRDALNSWNVYYSGPLDTEGRPSAKSAEVVFVDTFFNKGETWTYQGEVAEGLLSGKGVLRSSCSDRSGEECRINTCETEFDHGLLKHARCSMHWWRSEDAQSVLRFDAKETPQSYDGGVAASSSGFRIFLIGPFFAAFEGEGTLSADDGRYRMQGMWTAGALNGQGQEQYALSPGGPVKFERSGRFSDGGLLEGMVFGKSTGFGHGQTSYTVHGGNSENGVLVDILGTSVTFGGARNSGREGYRISKDRQAGRVWVARSTDPGGGTPLATSSLDSCIWEQALDKASYKPALDHGWSLDCSGGDDGRSCRIEHSLSGLWITVTPVHPPSEDVTLSVFLGSTSDKGPAPSLLVDDKLFHAPDSPGGGGQLGHRTDLAVGSFCGAKAARNMTTDQPVPVEGVCDLLAEAVTRVVRCN